jgi:hypothetical protein
MKGTFFSSDFVKDSQGNIKFLEVNTDTTTGFSGLDHFDWSSFKSVLVENNIDRLELIYKLFTEEIIESLETYIQNDPNLQSIQIVKHVEDYNSIYPVEIDESETTFVLRFAYSESAILDSEYAKDNLNLFDLFISSDNQKDVPDIFYSSSEQIINNLDESSLKSEINIPDFVVKDRFAGQSTIGFYKVGKTTEDNSQRLIEFIDTVSNDEKIIQNFYDTISESNKVTSLRSFDIIYGNNLDIINVASFEAESAFEIPSVNEVSSSFDDTKIDIQLDDKYFYLYSTNHFKTQKTRLNGLFQDEKVIKSDSSTIAVKDLVENDELRSYHIEGLPDTDDESIILEWSVNGSQMPSGSYETTTTVFDNIPIPLKYNFILKVDLQDNLSFRIGENTLLLVYDSINDKIKYKIASNIIPNDDKLFLTDDSLVNVVDIKYEILDGTYSTNSLNVEEEDVYYLSLNDGTSEVPVPIKVLVHNCFVAGTKITMADKTVKNIEDVVEGDKVLTYDIESKEFKPGTVGDIRTGEGAKIVEITDEFGNITKVTPTHKYYTVNHGWIFAQNIEEGDTLLNAHGEEVKVDSIKKYDEQNKVYHLLNIENAHTFFANSTLVHNVKVGSCFISGALIEMADGSQKPIENIEVGDEVASYDYVNHVYVKSRVSTLDNLFTVGTHSDACRELGNTPGVYQINDYDFYFTPEHPFLTKEGWKSLLPYPDQEPFATQQEGREQLIVGDEILVGGEWVRIDKVTHHEKEEKTPVYNIHIEGTHTYVVNGAVAHNKKCFTSGQRVLMSNGELLPIENIKIGDEVTTMEGEVANVEDVYVYDIKDTITMYTNGVLTVTDTHPLFINGEWKTADELGWDIDIRYVDKLYNLKTNSNFIIEGIPADGKTHDELVIEKNPFTGHTQILNKNLVG